MNSTEEITNTFKRNFVYFEKQSNDRLCGVHCLNSLLQGPFFDPVAMAEIAHRLDEMEMSLYKEDTDQNSNAKGIGNVDDDGNYNVQVLGEALKIHYAEIISVKQSECKETLSYSLDAIEAFIFNSSTHWFSIRKIDGVWFNLNSTNPGPGPQIISDFYLSAFIKGTEELGYTNFLVRNVPALPDIDSDMYKNLQYNQKLVSVEDILKYKPKKINMGDTDDMALERAIELSKQEIGINNTYSNNTIYDNNKRENNDNNINEYHHYTDINNYSNYDDQFKEFEKNLILDDELNQAIEMSMNDYVEELERSLPKEPNSEFQCNHPEVKFQPNDKKSSFIRRFNSEDKVRDLKNFAKVKLRTYGEIRLLGMNDNKIYINDEETLNEAGVKNGQTIIVKINE